MVRMARLGLAMAPTLSLKVLTNFRLAKPTIYERILTNFNKKKNPDDGGGGGDGGGGREVV